LRVIKKKKKSYDVEVNLRLTDPCITQLEVQGPSRTYNERKEEEEEGETASFRSFAPSVFISCVVRERVLY